MVVEGDGEHLLVGGGVWAVVNVVDEVLEVDGLEVDGVVEEDDVVAVKARQDLLLSRGRVGRRQEL